MDRKIIRTLGEYGQNLAASPNEFAIANVIALVISELETKPAPEAYMGYALYDSDSVLYKQGKVVLSKKSRNKHEELVEKIAVKKDGYIETFLVNETSENVWFDQFRVMSTGPLIVQETHYDPLGVELSGLGYQYGGIKVNPYLYQGKEFQEVHGLNLYDFHARGYDPAIGRTWQQDSHAESYYDLSPYSWVANNPINVIDPTGMDTVNVNNVDMRTFNPDVDVVGLDEVTVTASYTGPKASDSPNVRFALSHYFSSDRPLATGAVNSDYTIESLTFPILGFLKALKFGRWAAKGGQTIITRSVGAAPKGFSTVLQSGGHTLNNSTLKALGLTKGQGKIAIEALKTDLRLPANFHGKIMGNGDLVHPHTREVLGNLFDNLY